MNIYFSCSITGGRSDQEHYQVIVDHLLSQGHMVPTAHLSRPDVLSLETVVAPRDVFLRDIKWIDECDALIAEVSTPSHGVGYEIAYALSIRKPSLCIYQAGKRVSKIITGNNHPCIRVFEYRSSDELISILENFLEKAGSRVQ